MLYINSWQFILGELLTFCAITLCDFVCVSQFYWQGSLPADNSLVVIVLFSKMLVIHMIHLHLHITEQTPNIL